MWQTIKSWFKKIFTEEVPPEVVQQVQEEAKTTESPESILRNVHLREDIKVDAVRDYAETINRYCQQLKKDIAEPATEKQQAIATRLKQVVTHGLELKNILGQIEEHLLRPTIEALKKVETHKPELKHLLQQAEEDQQVVIDADAALTRVIDFDTLLNPEHNPNVEQELKHESKRRELMHAIDHLMIQLNTLADPRKSIEARLKRHHPLQKAKELLHIE